MVSRFLHSRRVLGTAALAASLLALPALRPSPALAHWGVCNSDPKVWLADGSQVDMATSVEVDPTMVSQVTFTLHVPYGVGESRIVYTSGSDVPPETVNVVPDSISGYTVSFTASTAGPAPYPTTLTVHVIDRSSTWASASGVSDQAVTVAMSNG